MTDDFCSDALNTPQVNSQKNEEGGIRTNSTVYVWMCTLFAVLLQFVIRAEGGGGSICIIPKGWRVEGEI